MGKGGRCVRLTTLPPSSAVVMKSGNLNFLEHSGPVTGLLYLFFFIFIFFYDLILTWKLQTNNLVILLQIHLLALIYNIYIFGCVPK